MDEKKEFKEYCLMLKKNKDLNNRILFVKVPQINFNLFNKRIAKNRGYQVYPPTGLQYLSQALDERGLDIKILDLNYEFLKRVQDDKSFDHLQWMNILGESIDLYHPSFVGIENTFRMEQQNFEEVLKYLKKREDKPIVFVGGQNATYVAAQLLEEELCHFVCQREAENKLNYLFDQFKYSKGSPPTSGILFKLENRICSTGNEPDIVELKGNLIEEHKKYPIENYVNVGTLGPFSKMAGRDTPFATILLNRGCRANCNFCTVRDYMGKGVRSRNIKDVIDEMAYLYFERGIKHFEFLDDDITRHKKALIGLLKELQKKGIERASWSAQNGIIAYSCDEELLSEMQKSHCSGFKVGVETGNPVRLKKIRKPGTIKSFLEFSKRAQKFPELFISYNYILGFPGETFKEMMDTFTFSGELNPDWCSFSVYIPLGNKSKEEDKDENFIPLKSSYNNIPNPEENILEGYDVFKIAPNEVPSRRQVKEIWFVFNMLRNFIGNKNLRPGGNLKQFIRWLTVIQETYSLNADIPFFLSFAYQLIGNNKESKRYYNKSIKNLNEYWKRKFDQFGLTKIVTNFPKNSNSAETSIRILTQHAFTKTRHKQQQLGGFNCLK